MKFGVIRIEGKPRQNIDGKHEKLEINPKYEEEHFWNTLDTKLVNWTYDQPSIIGIPLRFLFAIIPPGTNRMAPYPTGSKDKVKNLWDDKPRWVRWLFWHLRNFMEDFRKYYLGFGKAFYEDRLWYAGFHVPKNSNPDSIWKEFALGVFLPKFKWLPFRVPFPTMELRPWPDAKIPIRFVIGWKKRGILSITLTRAD